MVTGSCVLRETILKGRPRLVPRVSLSIDLSILSIYPRCQSRLRHRPSRVPVPASQCACSRLHEAMTMYGASARASAGANGVAGAAVGPAAGALAGALAGGASGGAAPPPLPGAHARWIACPACATNLPG